jgi:cell filamentation protein
LSFLIALAEHAGHPLTLESLDPGAMLRATVASFTGNEKPLAALIEQLIR